MPPFFSAGVRFIIASLGLFLFAYRLKLKIPSDLKSHLFFIYFSLSIFTFSYGLIYWGEQYINSGLTSVLFAVMPFYTAIFSIKLLPSEKITIRKVMGIIIGISGVAIIFIDQLIIEHPLALYGMIAALISPAFSAYGSILGKKATHRFHPVIINILPLLYAGIIFLIIAIFTEPVSQIHFTFMSYFSLLYLSLVGTALAFAVYFWLLKNTSVLLMSSITFITPPLALIWGWLTLDELITWKLFIGMIVVFCGIYFVRDPVKYNPVKI